MSEEKTLLDSLREERDWHHFAGNHRTYGRLSDAVVEIEELRSQRAKLLAALKSLVKHCQDDDWDVGDQLAVIAEVERSG